ncbi:MAG: hypothetical protein R3176_06780 [Woeseiaceae bacterium]|nr:hypothetical protein [Woeseiaceae bacterium]
MTLRGRSLPAGVMAFGAVLAPATARPGDDDKPPPYKIYIDPVTGKYTTEDPAATRTAQPAGAAASAAPGAAPDTGTAWHPGPGTLVIIIMLLAAVFTWHRRQPAN